MTRLPISLHHHLPCPLSPFFLSASPRALIRSPLLQLSSGVQRWSLCAECCWCQGCWTGVPRERAPLFWRDGWVNKCIRGLCHIFAPTHGETKAHTHTRGKKTMKCTLQMHTHWYLTSQFRGVGIMEFNGGVEGDGGGQQLHDKEDQHTLLHPWQRHTHTNFIVLKY